MQEHEIARQEAEVLALRWYGWGSPVGLGLFAVLAATAFTLVRLGLRW